MTSSNDSIQKTFVVAFLLCVVCSVLVSTSAVKLKPFQEANKRFDIKKNLLLASGLLDNPKASKEEVDSIFSQVETLVVDARSGKVLEGVDPDTVFPRVEAKTPGQNYAIDSKADIAGLKVKSARQKVYLVKKGSHLDMVILPISGKGLWSTLYGFLALESDFKTVRGIGFYEHGETPGLGGEVDNPDWKASWKGKVLYDGSFQPTLRVVKGKAKANNEIDGLSGATMTSKGVENLVRYWLGADGHGPLLRRLRETL